MIRREELSNVNEVRNNNTARIAVIGSLIIAVILVAGTIWMGRYAKRDTEEAVREVSLLYLDELAGRREQVVENNLQEKIQTVQIAIDLMTEEDLSDKAHMEDYQTRMKQLLKLDRFAFVDTEGRIYSSRGMDTNIADYDFDYKTLSEPKISVINQNDDDKRVVIAVPVNIPFQDETLSVCFISINMDDMLAGVSMTTNTGDATFCNIYADNGKALTNAVLGGLAEEDNLLDAMKIAVFENPYSYDQFVEDFKNGSRGVVSFTYNGIRETLAYIPVSGTDCQLTYLIRESVISDRISTISDGTVRRSVIQSALTVAAMLLMFGFIISQTKRNSRLLLEKETADTENRVKQEELEHRLELQERLLAEKRQTEQQSRMITALSSDYWSVYYLDLETDDGICYQAHGDLDGTGFKVGEEFKYLPSVTAYAKQYITEPYLETFLAFIQPDAVREGLRKSNVISYTYMVTRHGKETYETVRFAAMKDPNEPAGRDVNHVGACFADVDAETRKSFQQNQTLSDALNAAEEASRAKTAFLSNMSHEIRTPMNAIIGLDNIALSDPATPEKTREYLVKIGDSAEHLLNLINDILDMTRIESGRMVLRNEEFSFSRLLEAVNTMFSSQCNDKGLDYQCYINGEVDDYYIGDNMKLRQVLINILGNAVKFTPAGGKVSLQVERKAQFDGKTTLQFTISDTGIGMSKEFIPHIFDTFAQEDSSTTNKYGSSGLGLAITKSIVEMMNGTIEVESTKGEGTTFTVNVTLDDVAGSAQTPEQEIHPGEMTVLIVDDDPVACEHARLVLEKVGIAAEIADSGAAAVEMVRLRHARHAPYNLILVDWQMPEMDGVETTRRIRSIIGNESAIIILTAYKWDDILDEAIQAGVDSFIAKPLFAAAVMEEFRSAMQRKNLAGKGVVKKTDLTGCRILLAEDVQVNAEIIEMVLQMRGVTADLAENGRIAVEKFEASPEGSYDAILMDMRMPEMDGLEATRRIRELDRADAKNIPIIALTANAFDEDVQRSLQAGLNAHLSKPVQPDTLFETLESLIGQHESEQ